MSYQIFHLPNDLLKASVLFETRNNCPRAILLLRLPPLSVSLTPEVRCAVVGNVDSGKSTTLGVLTRGMPCSLYFYLTEHVIA